MLHALHQLGYATVADTAPAIIQKRKKNGLSPRPRPVEFVMECLQSDIFQYESATSNMSAFVFFDRSVLDTLGILSELGHLSDAERKYWVVQYPYYIKAFILPPWREIYETDSERDQTFEEAIQVYDRICHWYTQCGYQLIEVAPGLVNERCDYVLGQLM
jgi:predicted ATPase